MKQFLAVAVTIVLCINLMAQTQPETSYRAQVMALPAGTKLTVQTKSREKIRGLLVSVSQDSFTVAVGGTTTPRVVAFDEIERLSAHKPTHTPAVAWILTGALIGVVVIAVAVFAIERHNE